MGFRKSIAISTVYEVAKRAAVSPATVSRVLSNSTHPVSAETRLKVLRAARELNFLPNALARSLLLRQSKAIGVLIPDVSNPYYAGILRGVEDMAGQHGYSVIACNTDRNREKQLAYLRSLLERRVDGIVVTGGTFEHEEARLLKHMGLPAVLIGRHPVRLPTVGVDNHAAARLAVQHLIDLGHRRIAFVAGPPQSLTAHDRLEGYRSTLEAAGLKPSPELVVAGDFTAASGYEATFQLMQTGDPPTAIVASNDRMAIGAMRALHEMGLEVPTEVSVVGFDDAPLAPFVVPALTTVSVPMYDLGRKAAELLFARLGGRRVSSLELEVKLVVRETTARAPVRREPRGRSASASRYS
jgi:LacI family transcriptional regulator